VSRLGGKIKPRGLKGARGFFVTRRAVLVIAACLVDLQVTSADDRWVSCARSDLQHGAAAAVGHLDEEHVSASAALLVVDGTADEGNRNFDTSIAAIGHNYSFAMEVDDVDGDLRGAGGDARAGINDDVLALKMGAGEVIHDIPVSAVRGFRAASGIDDSAKGVVRRALGLVNGATARQPAGSRRRRHGTEIAAEFKVHQGRCVADDLNFLAGWGQGSPSREGGGIDTDGIGVEAWQCYFNDTEVIGDAAIVAVGTGSAYYNASSGCVVGTGDSNCENASIGHDGGEAEGEQAVDVGFQTHN